MKKYLITTLILTMTAFLFAGCVEYDIFTAIRGPQIDDNYPEPTLPLGVQRADDNNSHDDAPSRVSAPPQDTIKIGVTHPSHDNVGQILNFFGNGVDFYALECDDLGNLERLSEFYAIFINCGSHDSVNSRVLRSYVTQGGIVYASDLAGRPLTSAFPDMFEYTVVDPSLTVRNADIPHSSLASHMGIEQLDVIFNMGGWYVITELSEDATAYIEGYVPGHGTAPLAISFEYGEGTVFFTSFHNNAQATSYMIDFIEYLIFRIKFIEADRTQSLRAASEEFEFQGQVFGFFARSSAPVGDAFAAEAEAAEMPMAMEADSSQAVQQQTFQYNFVEGENFMLMVEAHGENFTLRLRDPLGNVHYISEHGDLISRELTSSSPRVSQLIFENIEGEYGVRVRNAIGGEWSFTIVAEDANSDAVFAVGIATQSN